MVANVDLFLDTIPNVRFFKDYFFVHLCTGYKLLLLGHGDFLILKVNDSLNFPHRLINA